MTNWTVIMVFMESNHKNKMLPNNFLSGAFSSLQLKCRDKGIEFLPQTQIFQSLYLFNPISVTFDISNFEFC